MRYTSLIFSVEKTFIEIVTTAICEMLCDESDDPLIAVIASPLSVLTTRIARLLLLPLGRICWGLDITTIRPWLLRNERH